MSKAQMALAGIVAITFFTIIYPSAAFAEIATPFNEWDFDILEILVIQDPNDLEMMRISIPVLFNGEWKTGITNIDVKITDPRGYDHTLFGQTRILEIEKTQVMEFKYRMPSDGDYTIDVSLTSPSTKYPGHEFHEDNTSMEIVPNGLLEKYDTIGDEDGKIISYFMANPSEVKYDKVVHAKINLPENHMYEKIVLVNGKFVKEYSIDTKDIYIKSELYDYSNMKVKIVEEGNLIPLADAQNTLQEYVVFYSMDKDDCYNTLCVNIDFVEEEEFPYWMLIVTGVAIAIVVGKSDNHPRNKIQIIMFS